MEEKIEVVELKEGEEFPITLTAAATTAAIEAMSAEGYDESYGLRIGVRGGGCSGLQYVLDFENERRFGDFIFAVNGLKIFLDPASATHLEGTVIDYITELMNTGFKFNNPAVSRTCGCGSSFS